MKITVAKVNKPCYYQIASKLITLRRGLSGAGVWVFVNFINCHDRIIRLTQLICQLIFVNFSNFIYFTQKWGGIIVDFYSIFLAQCAKKGSTPSSAASAIGLSNAAATGWKNGKQPSAVTLAKLANYFGCDITDLTVQKEKPAQESGLSVEEIKEAFRGKSFEELTEILAALTDELKNTK